MEKMPYGFKDFAGVVWRDAWVDTYNTLSETIEQKRELGLDCEALLNGRHNFFTSIAELGPDPKRSEPEKPGRQRELVCKDDSTAIEKAESCGFDVTSFDYHDNYSEGY